MPTSGGVTEVRPPIGRLRFSQIAVSSRANEHPIAFDHRQIRGHDVLGRREKAPDIGAVLVAKQPREHGT
jgi:hypothetical protein